MAGLVSMVNMGTATVTNDFVEEKELQEHPGPWRAIMRLVLTVALGVILVFAVVILSKSLPYVRLVQKEYKPPIYAPLPTNESVPTTQRVPIQTCPCFSGSFSWTRFITFSLIAYNESLDPQYSGTTVEAVSYVDTICSHENRTLDAPYICELALEVIMGADNQKTFIQTPNLLPPISLYNLVLLQMRTNTLTEDDIFQYLNTENDKDVFNYSKFILSLIIGMIKQQRLHVSSSAQEFWNASREALAGNELQNTSYYRTGAALGMKIDWDEYSNLCAPTFCDSVEEYPVGSRVFHAMSEVGGFLSIALFFVRTLLWPALARLFRFYEQPTAAD